MNEDLIIYTTDKNYKKTPIGNKFVSFKNTLTIWSYKKFDISVISGECNIAKIYLNNEVTDNFPSTNYETNTQWILDDKKYKCEISKIFSGEYSENNYTLILESNSKISINGKVYEIILHLDNEFSENIDDEENNNWPQQHYNDLLVNYYLPTWEELEPCIFDINSPNAKRELIKRMLLDFRKIVKYKGTIESIKLFFKFINFKNVLVFEEYAHKNNNGVISKTIKPNKLTDWKTGDYHILMKNYDQENGNEGYDSKNMPIRKLYVRDWNEFFEKLILAINLGDKYFTLPEQEISFFGIEFSSNAHLFLPIQMWGQRIFKWHPNNFQNNIDINITKYYNKNEFSYIVKNKKLVSDTTYMSEVKALINEIFETKSLFFIEEEIFDDDIIDNTDNFDNYYSYFGNILHCEIKIPGKKYVKVYIENINKPDINICYDKKLIGDDNSEYSNLKFIFSCTEFGNYRIRIDVWDVWNNRESYLYEYEISAKKHEIDFETFTSILVKEEQNTITLEPSSPSSMSIFSSEIINFVLSQNYIPEDLKKYYDVNINDVKISKELIKNKIYQLPDFNNNWILDNITDTLPLDYLDNWINIITFPYNDYETLKIRVYDGDICDYVLIDYYELPKYYSKINDDLFVTLMDITIQTENETYSKPYYFITSTSVGIDLKSNFDFVLVNKNTNEIKSVYELIDLKTRKFPLNYDIELFCRKSDIVPEFIHYISGVNAMNGETKLLKSVFPRLTDIKDKDVNGNFVEFGDVVLCRLNEKYVTDYSDVEWNVRNSFTKEIIETTSDESLKFRINELNVFDVEVKFTIRGQNFRIYKESLFTSFKCNI